MPVSDLGVFVAVLARRPDQELPGSTRLDIEGDGVGLHAVRALEVSKLHELVMKEAWIAVGDEQVAFAFFYRQRGQQSAVRSGREHDAVAVESRSVGQSQLAVACGDREPCNTVAPNVTALIEKPVGGRRRIDDSVVGHKEPAGKPWPEFGFFRCYLGLHSGRLRVLQLRRRSIVLRGLRPSLLRRPRPRACRASHTPRRPAALEPTAATANGSSVSDQVAPANRP